jgi:hypothetical protein
MSRSTRLRLDVALLTLGIGLILVGPGSPDPRKQVLAGSGTTRATVSVYLPLVVSWPVPVLPNHSWHVSGVGSMWIVGEVRNNTADAIELVSVTAQVCDGDGQVLTTAQGYVELDRLPPGEKGCFDILVGMEPSNWATYEFEPPIFHATAGLVPDLTIVSDSGTYDPTYGWFQIAGQVRNDHTTRVENIEVVGALYTDSGQVVGCQSRLVEGRHLDSGQSGPFGLTFSGRDYLDVASYRLQAGGTPP